MKLEEQVMRMASLGIPLNDGINLDDLLRAFDRDEYEINPFILLLNRMGSALEKPPWGMISDRVWYFDKQCIEGEGSYQSIVERLVLMSRNDDRIEDVNDSVDLDMEYATLSYQVEEEPRRFAAEVSEDWADLSVLRLVMRDLESDGYRFAAREDGRAIILIYLDDDRLDGLNASTSLRFSWFTD